MTKRRLATLALALCAAAWTPAPATAADHVHVIAGFQYLASGTATVPFVGSAGLQTAGLGYPVLAGDTITFVNADVPFAPHTVTAFSGAFDTGAFLAGEIRTISTAGLGAGTHSYLCLVHPFMVSSFTII